MLDTIKLALRVSGSAYDAEIQRLIYAALADLGISDIDSDLLTYNSDDPLIVQAVATYCRMNFGSPHDYDKLAASYREQKKQMSTNNLYTLWE